MRAIAVAAISLLLVSCVDSDRLRSDLGGSEAYAAEASLTAPTSALASQEQPGLAKRGATR